MTLILKSNGKRHTMYQYLLACKDDICVADSVENLMKETHELGGSDVVVDRATPKVIV